MRIYLDDERSPKVEQFDHLIRTPLHFKLLVSKLRSVSYISFDHDLGSIQTGYDCAKWLVRYDMSNGILAPGFTFNVHSANPVGATNIRNYLNNYLEHKCTS